MSFLDETTDLLRRTPEVLRTLLGGLPERWTDTPDTPDGWRPRDVVGHLITSEETNWMARTRLVMEHGRAVPFAPVDRFRMLDRDVGVPLDELLTRFAALRARNLEELADLVGDADLGRQGLHPALGEVSLRNLLAAWAVHDLDHVAQVYAGLAGAYDAEVGTWKAYLGILLRRDDPAAVPG